MEYAKCCRDCVLNHDCLLQKNDDVESCEDYRKAEIEEIREKNNPQLNTNYMSEEEKEECPNCGKEIDEDNPYQWGGKSFCRFCYQQREE